jgi:hypothetical protein
MHDEFSYIVLEFEDVGLEEVEYVEYDIDSRVVEVMEHGE